MKTDAPILFNGLAYGMGRAEVSRKINCGPCAEGSPLTLCALEPCSWLEQKWEERLFFNNLWELQQVLLTVTGKIDCLVVEQAMIAAGWMPVFLETEEGAAELLAGISKTDDNQLFRKVFEEEKKAAAAGSALTVCHLPREYFEKIAGKIRTYDRAVEKAGENIVQADLMIGGESLRISFTAPLLARKNALRYGEMIKR